MDEGKELPQDGDTVKKTHVVDSEQKNLAELWALRNSLNKQCERDVAERKRTNSEYTEEEMRLGADHRERTVSQYDQENQIAGEYIEELEPQLREQVLKINRKGYMTQYAGFFGENCDQQIMGDFRLNEETLQRLTVLGISVYTGPNWNLEMERQSGIHREDIPEDAKFTTVIKFHPENADLQAIGAKWEQVADSLPDRGVPSKNWYQRRYQPSGAGLSPEFLREWGDFFETSKNN